MYDKVKTKILLALVVCFSAYGMAQTSVNAAGGEATGPGGQASYALGQVFFTTIGGNGTTASQGVQQVYMQPFVAVPTMSEWGFIVLMLLSMIIGVLFLKAKESSYIIQQKENKTVTEF